MKQSVYAVISASILTIIFQGTILAAFMQDRISVINYSNNRLEIESFVVNEQMSVSKLSTVLQRVVTSTNLEAGVIKYLIELISRKYVDEMVRAIKGEITVEYALRSIGATRNGKHTQEELQFLRELKECNRDMVIPVIDRALQRNLATYLHERLYQLVTAVSQPVIRNNDICSLLNPTLYDEDITQRIRAKIPLYPVSILLS